MIIMIMMMMIMMIITVNQTHSQSLSCMTVTIMSERLFSRQALQPYCSRLSNSNCMLLRVTRIQILTLKRSVRLSQSPTEI
jgi:hypothetical protein